MGLFSKLTDAIKDAAPVIGGVVGFGLGGPMGAGIGSGIGGLVAGQKVNEAMKTALIGGTLGYGARAAGFAPASAGGFMPQFVGPKASVANTAAMENIGAQPSGIFGNLFSDMTTGQKLALGLGGLGAVAALTQDEEEEEFERRPEPVGEMFDITSRSRDQDRTLFLTDPEDLAQYQRELAGSPFMPPISRMHGGEVHGPGTGTSDSVPARLSDGEFVLTAKAVRGAGGGDRDIGAARMYDMMSELEAQA